MTDYVTYQKQDGAGEKASYSFGFLLDAGGTELSVNVDVLTGETNDITEAFELAKQRASDAKQEYIDKQSNISVVGPVSLPPPRKKDNISDVSATT